jgi:hypothetical protein
MLNDPSGTAPQGAACRVPPTPEQMEKRGKIWVIAAFLICPCHLPFTLGLIATLLAGTALGVALHRHLVLAGVVISLAWLIPTWRGVHLVRSARALAARLEPRDPVEPTAS